MHLQKLPDLNQSKGLFDSQDTENIGMGKYDGDEPRRGEL